MKAEVETGNDGTSIARGASLPTYALVLAFAISLALLYALFGKSTVNFNDLALGPQTTSVNPSYDGDPIHCATLDDADNCLKPAVARRLKWSIVWLGNSQLHAINQLKNGEVPASAVLARRLRPVGIEALTFSQPNASLVEHLLMFEALANRLRITALVLPLVFDDTRETSIRNGIAIALDNPKVRVALLRDPIGRRVVAQIAAANARKQKPSEQTFQDRSENAITGMLESCCSWETLRRQARGGLYYWLYTTRNTALGIKPTSKRRKIPAAYEKNLAAYTQILRRSRELGITVLAYIAPLRSDAPRPYVKEEYEAFKRQAETLAAKFGARFLDLEELVPNRHWGTKGATSIGGEQELDFMHFQYAGHELLAEKIAVEIGEMIK